MSGISLAVSAGINLIHVPLQVTTVDGMAQTITSIADLYDRTWWPVVRQFLITYDATIQGMCSIVIGSPQDRVGTAIVLTDDTGIRYHSPDRATFGWQLIWCTPRGQGDRKALITLNSGLNLVGLPLRDSRTIRVSNLLRLKGLMAMSRDYPYR